MITILYPQGGRIMTKRKIIITTSIIILFGCFSWPTVQALGKRSYGQSCRVGGHIASFFSSDREESTCDSDQGLLCAGFGGTCTCPPGRIWDSTDDKSACLQPAGSPCFGRNADQRCVSNANCEFAICRCNSKFYSSRGRCMPEAEEVTESASRPSGGIFTSILHGSNSNNNDFVYPPSYPSSSNDEQGLTNFQVYPPPNSATNNFDNAIIKNDRHKVESGLVFFPDD